jgi:hypothetical protein
MSANLIDDLKDLHKQATVERSHFYVGSVVERAIEELERYQGLYGAVMPFIEVNKNGTAIYGGTPDVTYPDGSSPEARLIFPSYLRHHLGNPKELEVFFRVPRETDYVHGSHFDGLHPEIGKKEAFDAR